MNSENNLREFNQCVEPLDWRYSAAIVGLYKYFQYTGEEDIDYRITDDTFEFNEEDITKERYLEFVEYYYGEDLQHKKIENILTSNDLSEEQIKFVNELMQGNTILKKVFKKIKFDGTNINEIQTLIEENRLDLILETFRNKKNMYAHYANTNQLFNDSQDRCRLLGYYVDGGRKSKAISYNFDTKTFVSKDQRYFDFIPFAFIGEFESFFLNDSFSVIQLIKTNINFEHYVRNAEIELEGKGIKARNILIQLIHQISDFLDYDVEIIYKNRDEVFFETMYLRKESIEVIKSLENYQAFNKSVKVNEEYIDLQKSVFQSILNLTRTDQLIEMLLKEHYPYIISQLIKLNVLICKGGETMNQSMKNAYGCAKQVVEKIPKNKIDSYRQKLISSVVFKDYDRCCQILLQMSNYCDIPFNFAFSLFENFEDNKDIVYTFINALTKNNSVEQEEK